MSVVYFYYWQMCWFVCVKAGFFCGLNILNTTFKDVVTAALSLSEGPRIF